MNKYYSAYVSCHSAILLRKVGFSEKVSGRYFQTSEDLSKWSFSSHRNRLDDRNYNNFYLETPTQHYLSAPTIGEALSWILAGGYNVSITKSDDTWFAKCFDSQHDYKVVYDSDWEGCANRAIICICETIIEKCDNVE